MLSRIRLSGGRQIDAGLEDQLAREGSIAKLKCTEVAKRAALEGVQLMGGNGYTVEFGMESQVRKALAPPIYGGANEIQREIIGKSWAMTRIFDPMVLDGKRILITGGGTGWAAAWLRSWSPMAPRCICGVDAKRCWPTAAAEISAGHPGRVHYQAVNVRDFDQVAAAIDEIWHRHGPLTGLLNNAAANFIAPTVSLSPRAFEAVTSTVMTGSFNTTLAVGRALDRRRPAWIGAVKPDHMGVERFGVRGSVGHGKGGHTCDDDVVGRRVGPLRHSSQCPCAGTDSDRVRLGNAQSHR